MAAVKPGTPAIDSSYICACQVRFREREMSRKAYEELQERETRSAPMNDLQYFPPSTSTHNARHPLLLCHQVSLLLQLDD
jgi:hypothetical protein